MKYFVVFILFLSCSDGIESPYHNIVNDKLILLSIQKKDVIDLDDRITLKFNRKLDYSSLYRGIKCRTGDLQTRLYFNTKEVDGNYFVMINSNYPFLPYLKYNCEISKDIEDMYRNKLGKNVYFTFKTSDLIFQNSKLYAQDFKDIENLLKYRCSSCHNAKHEVLNFNLEHNELKDVLLNKYVIKNNPRDSLLIKKLVGNDFEGYRMPKGKKMTVREIKKIYSWIDKM